MRQPIRLTSGENPRIKEVLHLRKNRDRRAAGVFIAEGKREITRAIAAGLNVRQFFFCPELAGAMPNLNLGDAELYELPAKLFSKIAYLEKPEGLLAIFNQPAWQLNQLTGDLWLIATGIEKPGNLGAMARTAAAARCAGLIITDENVDAFNSNAIRASTGAVFSLPIIEATSDQAIEFCRHHGIKIVAATPEANENYTDIDLTPPTAIVIGAEHQGLNPAWKSVGTQVRIPMAPGVVDSLNASTCAAVLLFEAVRQKRAPKRQGIK
ncbi:MAG TPA: TrmH family RNA methyltransferase [Tepidisphaeraceae bacterium]|nr:TrmH family RNA methyltransferase [Tepidisphaeraceae bacterium]